MFAHPSGGEVKAGKASFEQNGSRLSIRQLTDRAVIDWKGFSIGQGESTCFVQPSSQSAVLNRVRGSLPSTIHGNLSANGKVFLINPNGVIIGPGGQVKTGSFAASTLDINDSEFMSGKNLLFSGDSVAFVSNHGSVTATDGNIVLIAAQVENTGTLDAGSGTVGLAAGNEVLMAEKGEEHLIVKSAIRTDESEAGVHNTGLIKAAHVELKAVGGNVYSLAVNNGGAVHAMGLVNEAGRVLLKSVSGNIRNTGIIKAGSGCGDGGRVRVQAEDRSSDDGFESTVINSGIIDTSGAGSGSRGGEIIVTGNRVALTEQAELLANGDSAGGKILIGGGLRGNDAAVANASRTFVGQDAKIEADAMRQGNGGSVVVWADEATFFYGDISARAGEVSGNGGSVEVSGKKRLEYQGRADLRASEGRNGNLTLDPTNVTIGSNGSTTLPWDDAWKAFKGNAAGGTPSNTYLNVADLQAQLALGNVEVISYWGDGILGDITVVDPINWSAATKLSLMADDHIFIQADITNPNGTLYLQPGFIDGQTVISSSAGAKINVSMLEYNLQDGTADFSGTVNAGTVKCDEMFRGADGFFMNNANNQIGAFEFNYTPPTSELSYIGNIEIVDSAGGLLVRGKTGPVTGHIHIRTKGDLTLDTTAKLSCSQEVALEAAGGGLVNNAGATVFQQTGFPTPDRFLIYASDPADNSPGGLTASRVYNRTFDANPPSTISGADYFLYSIAPVLKFNIHDKSRTYGDANPALTYAFTGGLVAGDTEAQAYSGVPDIQTSASATSDVGQYPITGAPGSLTSNMGYQFSFNPGTLNVTMAPLTIAANSAARRYGEPNPIFSATCNGLVAGDTPDDLIGLSINTDAVETSPVGVYDVVPSGVTNPNYAINYVNGFLSIGEGNLLIVADSQHRPYGHDNPELTVTYTGLQGNDDPSIVTGLEISTPATVDSPVGRYPIILAGGEAANYNIILRGGVLTVDPIRLMISAKDVQRFYGSPNPEFTADVTGLLPGDSGILNNLNFQTDATVDSDVGSYDIVPQMVSAPSYYNIVHQNGTLTIHPAHLTVTVNDESRLYGTLNPDFSTVISGLKAGDSPDVVQGIAFYTDATIRSKVGEYTVTVVGGRAENYVIAQRNRGTLTIEPAPLTISAHDATRLYGEENPVFTGTITGFVIDDTEAVVRDLTYQTPAAFNSGVGRYDIIPSATADNYTITAEKGNLTITPASLTITADDTTRPYKTENPAFTATYTGLVAGDNGDDAVTGLTFETTAVKTSDMGEYTITPVGGTSANYNILARNSGTLTIVRPTLVIRADDKSRLYGGQNPELTATITGLVGDDTAADVSGWTLSTPALIHSGVGNYPITPSGDVTAPDYYDIAMADGTLTITPAPLTITANDKEGFYGNFDFNFNCTFDGLVAGDDPSVIKDLRIAALAEGGKGSVWEQTDAGKHTLWPWYGHNDNYAITFKPGTLTLKPALLVIAGKDAGTVNIGDPYPDFEWEFEGLRYWDQDKFTDFDVKLTLSDKDPYPPVPVSQHDSSRNDASTGFLNPQISLTGSFGYTYPGKTHVRYIVPELNSVWADSNYDVWLSAGVLKIFEPDTSSQFSASPPPSLDDLLNDPNLSPEERLRLIFLYGYGDSGYTPPPSFPGFPKSCGRLLMAALSTFLAVEYGGMQMTLTKKREWLKNPANMVKLLPYLVDYMVSDNKVFATEIEALKAYMQDWMRDYQVRVLETALENYYQWRDHDRYDDQTPGLMSLYGPSTGMPDFIANATNDITTAVGLSTLVAAVTTTGYVMSTIGAAVATTKTTLFAAFSGSMSSILSTGMGAAAAGTVVGTAVMAVVIGVMRGLQIKAVDDMEANLMEAIENAKNFDINTLLHPSDDDMEDASKQLCSMLLVMVASGALDYQ